ncbi:MAG TPA: tetratricopeptide repeat protein [Polyangiaceae bacterium]|nr:tetratricopeptide repeat protein [Polyangiaceae bacterium]
MKRAVLTGVLFLILGVGAGCTRTASVSPEDASSIRPGRDAEPVIRRASQLLALGDYIRAEQYLNMALQRGADEKRVLPLLVSACIQDQRYRDAIQYLEQHLRRHPTQQNARFVLAGLHMSIGQTALAKKELEQVIARDPEQADAHYALATLLRDENGNYSAADSHFRAYLRLQPNGVHAEEAQAGLLVAIPESRTQ